MRACYPTFIPHGSIFGSTEVAALGPCTATLGPEVSEGASVPLCAATDEDSRQWEVSENRRGSMMVVGPKLTRGLVRTYGAISISKRQDICGSLTISLINAAYMPKNIADRRGLDHITRRISFDPYYPLTDLEEVTIGSSSECLQWQQLFDIDHGIFEYALRTLD